MKYYLLVIYDDVEAHIKGPYKTEKHRDNAAKRFRKKDASDFHHGLYPLDITKGIPVVGNYSGLFFDIH